MFICELDYVNLYIGSRQHIILKTYILCMYSFTYVRAHITCVHVIYYSQNNIILESQSEDAFLFASAPVSVRVVFSVFVISWAPSSH